MNKLNKKILLDELHARYARPKSIWNRFQYWRKKYLWIAVVEGTKGFKRAFDLTVSLFLLIIFSPIIAIIALIIKGYDGGNPLYISTRVGKWGKEFSFPKFRTMQLDAEEKKQHLMEKNLHQGDVKFKMYNDPRVTPFGNFLRKSSLDELPQLWTVIQGDMSLVGPRPSLPEEVARYTLEERRRLDTKPGLTCFWQVSGRSEIPFKKQVELDIAYIESQSLLLDLKLLAKTIPAVLFGKGAY